MTESLQKNGAEFVLALTYKLHNRPNASFKAFMNVFRRLARRLVTQTATFRFRQSALSNDLKRCQLAWRIRMSITVVLRSLDIKPLSVGVDIMSRRPCAAKWGTPSRS